MTMGGRKKKIKKKKEEAKLALNRPIENVCLPNENIAK